MGLGRLEGIPWHIEKLKPPPGEELRFRSACVFFRKIDEYCSMFQRRCYGPNHCEKYEVAEFPDSIEEEAMKKAKEKPKVKVHPSLTNDQKKATCVHYKGRDWRSAKIPERVETVSPVLMDEYKRRMPVHSQVVHMTFGEGTVVGYNAYCILVLFDDFGEKELDLEACFKRQLLKSIKEK